jgi:glycerol dehydrogenase
LLSGIGFESGGLALAHAIAQSYTAVPVVHANQLHGEMVAMGTLAQLVLESQEEARRVADFFARVGLPVHLGQLSLTADDKAALDTVVEVTMAFSSTHNMPMPMTRDVIRGAILDANELGLAVANSSGDAAWRKLHA